jgi:hypothetical protein
MIVSTIWLGATLGRQSNRVTFGRALKFRRVSAVPRVYRLGFGVPNYLPAWHP